MSWRACTKPPVSTVEREYYVNDAGNQMENLGLSLYARYLEHWASRSEFPEGGYPGDYVNELAAEVKARDGDKYVRVDKASAVAFFRQFGGDSLLNTIRGQLGEFSIRFDSYFSEKAMRERDEVTQSMTRLRESGFALLRRRRRVVSLDPIRRR